MYPKNRLNINLQSFGFVEREKVRNKKLANQCGRDFLYYALHYYFKDLHNQTKGNPRDIAETKLFGWSWLPSWLIWTGLSFKNVPVYLKSLNLTLTINKKEIHSYLDFLLATLPINPQSFEEGMRQIEDAISKGDVVGVDIALRLGGAIDHVMFVYGYDEENLYVFDTHQTQDLQYIKLTEEGDRRFIMKLPKTEVRKRWTIWNRIWVVKR